MEATTEFEHAVLFYGDEDEFLAGTVPYLEAAIEADAPALVAVGPELTALLEAELGEAAGAVTFADMRTMGRNPARIIPFWRDFVEAHGGDGAAVRGIGEPIWVGRSADELEECRRHECLLNVAFDDLAPWTLMCPYDSVRLADDVLEEAARCHPFVAQGGGHDPNRAWDEVDPSAEVFGGELPRRPHRATTVGFGRRDLASVRALVGARAEAAGLGPERAADLVTAASELAANSVAHGGGRGTLWIWAESGDLVVEVGDAGLISEPLVGRRKPPPAQDGGRGMWIANMLCDLVQIRSGAEGTTVRLRMSCD